MAQKVGKGHKHPVFKNDHNDGQQTTQHRAMEKSRNAANSMGAHPSHGSFNRDWGSAFSSPDGSPNPTQTFHTPAGASVTVTDNSPAKPNDHDATATVKGSDGVKHTSSRAAAKNFAQARYGVRP